MTIFLPPSNTIWDTYARKGLMKKKKKKAEESVAVNAVP